MEMSNIPEELKQRALWCVWKKNEKGKVPINPATGQFGKSNDTSTFASFTDVLSVVHDYYNVDNEGKVTGGLGLGIFKGYSAIDIDHCRDPKTGELSEMAQDIIEQVDSYTEISPSQTGIRILFKTESRIDKKTHYINNQNNGLEIYISDNTSKFVTVTGNVLRNQPIQDVNLDYVINTYMKKPNSNKETISTNDNSALGVSNKLQGAISRDDKLKKLWYAKAQGYGSNESETDLALCNKLAFYLDGDKERINKAFIASPYFESKDDAHKNKWLDREDYAEGTIEKSLKAVQEISQRRVDPLELNDTGNARRFFEKFGDRVRYNVENEQWHIYNGTNWQVDQHKTVKGFLEIVAEEMKQQAAITQHEDQAKALYKNVNRILSSSGKESMLKEAQHVEGIPVINDDFDKDIMKLNTASGIVDLRDGKISPHNRTEMHHNYSPYEVEYKTPVKWETFLKEIFEGDMELIDYLQKVVGYTLSGSTREQAMFILVGDGANGKSLFLDIINEMLGSYGATSNVEILLEKKQHSSNLGEIARLKGIRNVVTDETKIGDKINESAIKTLTSGTTNIVARFLYGREFEFTPEFKIFMATNHRPIIRGSDYGIWRRLKIIPFNRVFKPEEQDKDLFSKLKKELPKILGWAIQGSVKWHKEGLRDCPAVAEQVNAYKKEMDVLETWIEDNCETGNHELTELKDLYEDYIDWATTNREYQFNKTLFGKNLNKKFERIRRGGKTYYRNIEIKKFKSVIVNSG